MKKISCFLHVPGFARYIIDEDENAVFYCQ